MKERAPKLKEEAEGIKNVDVALGELAEALKTEPKSLDDLLEILRQHRGPKTINNIIKSVEKYKKEPTPANLHAIKDPTKIGLISMIQKTEGGEINTISEDLARSMKALKSQEDSYLKTKQVETQVETVKPTEKYEQKPERFDFAKREVVIAELAEIRKELREKPINSVVDILKILRAHKNLNARDLHSANDADTMAKMIESVEKYLVTLSDDDFNDIFDPLDLHIPEIIDKLEKRDEFSKKNTEHKNPNAKIDSGTEENALAKREVIQALKKIRKELEFLPRSLIELTNILKAYRGLNAKLINPNFDKDIIEQTIASIDKYADDKSDDNFNDIYDPLNLGIPAIIDEMEGGDRDLKEGTDNELRRNPELVKDGEEIKDESFGQENIDKSLEIKQKIEELKAFIQELEDAKRKGNLASYYEHSSNYMDQANEEVENVEKEIHRLEDLLNGKKPRKDRGVKPTDVTPSGPEPVPQPSKEGGLKKVPEYVAEKLKAAPVMGRKEALVEGDFKLGDLVHWESLGAQQWENPRLIKWLSPDGKWAFFDESGGTGIPVDQLKKVENEVINKTEKLPEPQNLAAVEIQKVAKEEKTLDEQIEKEELKGPDMSLKQMLEVVRQGGTLEQHNPENIPPKSEGSKQEQALKIKRKLGLVETDLMEKRTREVAAERMSRNKSELRGVSGFFKKIWTHNWMAEYYRAKEIEKVKEEMLKAGSTSTQGEDVPNLEGDRKLKGIILERFLQDTPGLVHEAAGEWKNKVDHISHEKRITAEHSVREAILAFVSNKDAGLAEGNLTEAINRAYADAFSDKEGDRNFEPLNIADNIKEYAREMRTQVEHGVAIGNLDLDFELNFGKAVTGARTEESYTWRDKIIQKMAKSPIGRFVNETTIAAAVCVTTAVASRASQWTMRATLGAVGGGLITGGALAAMRESQAIKRDRAEHSRAMASGRSFDVKNSPRRSEINETIYNMIPAGLAISNMKRMRDEVEIALPAEKEQKLMDLMNFVSSVEARITLSDKEKIDLMSYSGPQEMEFERTELDIERAKAKVAARKIYDELGMATKLGNFDSLSSVQSDAYEKNHLIEGKGGINAQNETFESLRRRRRNEAFVKGMVVAGVAGGIFRGAMEIGHHAKETLFGVPHADLTPSETMDLNAVSEKHTVMVNGTSHEVTNTINGSIKVPEGFHVMDGNKPGEYQIYEGGHYNSNGDLVGGKLKVDHITFEKASSQLTSDSEGALQRAGFGIGEHSESSTSLSTFTTESEKTLNVEEYTREHGQEFERSHRIGWADNNTKKPDLNELRLQDPKIGADGKIHISIRPMTHHGSNMGHRHLDVPKLVKEGKMELWLSATQSTQFTPAHVEINPDGTAVIDPNSPAGRLFKFDAEGHLLQRPKFTEAAAIMGEKGGEKSAIICATDVGKDYGAYHFTEKVTVEGVRENIDTKVITDLTYEQPEVDNPHGPFIPIPFFVPRNPLERTNGKEGAPYTYYNGASAEQLEKEMSGDKPFVPSSYSEKKVNGKTVWVDKEGNEVKRSAERENKIIKEYLEKQEKSYTKDLELFEKRMSPMNPKCRLAINIPARFEEKNLANLLDQYTKQVDEKGGLIDKDLFEVNVIINRKEGEVEDKSVQVIEEWKKKNPGFNVNVINIVFPKEKANVGMARKYVTDLTLRRSSNRPKSDGSLYIESEDADVVSVDKRMVWKLVKGFDDAPHLDVLRGVQDRQPEVMQKNDLLFFDRRLWDIMEISMRSIPYRPENTKDNSFVWNRVISGGWNTAYTAESYAQIGGYVSDLMGEDMKIGQKISLLRGSRGKDGKFIPNTRTAETSGLRSSSSPRRFIDAMTKKIDPYGDFENQAIKSKTNEELLDGVKQYAEVKKEQKGEYQSAIKVVNEFVKGQMVESQVGKVLGRVMWGMGLKEKDGHYLIDSRNNITLTDKGMDRIIAMMKDYKDKKKSHLGYRRQTSSSVKNLK